jgi:predicted flap endonuclease-1-like 5' DNA nuclease
MITWAIDYWYLCLAALLIGVATAAWIWLRLSAGDEASADVDAPARPSATPAKPLEPVKPVIDVAQPVSFTAPPAPEPVPVAPVVAAPAAAPEAFAAPVADAGAATPRPAIAAAVGDADDLTLLKGVGPKLNTLLISLGVTRFDQIAAWGDAEIGEVDGYLGNFKGRIVRDSWVEQAGLLARNDTAGFAAKFGALGSENKG